MRKTILIIMAAIFAVGVMAQQKMRVWKNNSLVYEEDVTQIDSITFYNEYEGTLNGVFSVSPTKKVRFSIGNLQYNAALGSHQCADGSTKQGTWRFAENQYDTIGSGNTKASSTYNGWIDLFGRGTSGWNSGANMYEPWSRSSSYSDFYVGGDYHNDLTGDYAYADWGVYNAISNGGNQPNQWRTLTKDEVKYLIYNREKANELYGYATINGITGLLILPDNWVAPQGFNFTPTTQDFSINTYSLSEWSQIASRVVFLLSGGVICHLNTYYMVNNEGDYWHSTAGTSQCGFFLTFRTDRFSVEYTGNYSSDEMSVRLVRDVK